MNARSSSYYVLSKQVQPNLDGGFHDDEVFTLGDDEDDDEQLEMNADGSALSTPATPPPAYTEVDKPVSNTPDPEGISSVGKQAEAETDSKAVPTAGTPSEYYIQSKDTLVGIALRFGVDVSAPCALWRSSGI
jgi:LysM repeat protein